MNGLPIRPEHGAPLRLIIPVKYGIKNLKRIGKYLSLKKDQGIIGLSEGTITIQAYRWKE